MFVTDEADVDVVGILNGATIELTGLQHVSQIDSTVTVRSSSQAWNAGGPTQHPANKCILVFLFSLR